MGVFDRLLRPPGDVAAPDDPFMRVFADDRVTNVLKKLVTKGDEAIESPMAARRIKAAQDELADRRRSDLRPRPPKSGWRRTAAGREPVTDLERSQP